MTYTNATHIFPPREVNEGGLVLLYKILVDSARPEIRTVLELILHSLRGGRPVLFFCKVGVLLTSLTYRGYSRGYLRPG
jgi:hypothetical protein